MDFQVTRNEKLIDRVSDSTLQLSLKNYHLLNFGVVSKNTHNHLKGLKYSSLFQPPICMRLEFLHILQPKQYIARLNVEADENQAVFYSTRSKTCKYM